MFLEKKVCFYCENDVGERCLHAALASKDVLASVCIFHCGDRSCIYKDLEFLKTAGFVGHAVCCCD